MHPHFVRVALVLLTARLCCGVGITVERVNGVAGGSVTFATTAKPSNRQFLAVAWSVNGTNIITSTTLNITNPKYKDRITLNRSTGSLELRNLTREDSGEYELSIIPDGGFQMIGNTVLEVYPKVPVPALKCPPAADLIEGNIVKLVCGAGDTTVAREWTKNGQQLMPGERIQFLENNRILAISPVNRLDGGEYLCNVSNAADHEVAKCSLSISYGPNAPIITQTPKVAEEEERVTLKCFSESSPEATFSWMFNQVSIGALGPLYVINELEDEHEGAYTCTARNAVTGAEASAVHMLHGCAVPYRGTLTLTLAFALPMTLAGLCLE